MSDYISACTVGSTPIDAASEVGSDADPVLDLNGLEEQELPFLTIATAGGGDRDADGGGKVVVLMMESRCQMSRLEGMVSVGLDGCASVRGLLDEVVREGGRKVLQGKGG